MGHAIDAVVPEQVQEVGGRRLEWIEKTRAAVKDRLTWCATQFDGGAPARGRPAGAPAETARRTRRRGAALSTRPPAALGGFVVVPAGLLDLMAGRPAPDSTLTADAQVSAARARAAVMEAERAVGSEPVDRGFERLGYDIENRDPGRGHLRFIEVERHVAGADTVTVTKNEILYSLNKPEASSWRSWSSCRTTATVPSTCASRSRVSRILA